MGGGASQLDDPLDAVAVHAWNGLWGVLAVGLFASKDLILQSYGAVLLTGDNVPERRGGLFMGGGINLLGAQAIYAVWIAGSPSPMFLAVPFPFSSTRRLMGLTLIRNRCGLRGALPLLRFSNVAGLEEPRSAVTLD